MSAHFLDGIAWKEVKAPDTIDELPYQTHEGILRIGDIELHCYQLNTGERVIDADDFNAFLGNLNAPEETPNQ